MKLYVGGAAGLLGSGLGMLLAASLALSLAASIGCLAAPKENAGAGSASLLAAAFGLGCRFSSTGAAVEGAISCSHLLLLVPESVSMLTAALSHD